MSLQRRRWSVFRLLTASLAFGLATAAAGAPPESVILEDDFNTAGKLAPWSGMNNVAPERDVKNGHLTLHNDRKRTKDDPDPATHLNLQNIDPPSGNVALEAKFDDFLTNDGCRFEVNLYVPTRPGNAVVINRISAGGTQRLEFQVVGDGKARVAKSVPYPHRTGVLRLEVAGGTGRVRSYYKVKPGDRFTEMPGSPFTWAGFKDTKYTAVVMCHNFGPGGPASVSLDWVRITAPPSEPKKDRDLPGSSSKPKGGSGQGMVIPVRPTDVTLLYADHARVAGQLRFDAVNHWITRWNSADDVTTWTCNAPAAGDYTLGITYACPRGSEGSRFEVAAGDSRVTGTVRATVGWAGPWMSFEKVPLTGTLHLPAGVSTVTLRVTERAPGVDALSLHMLDLIPQSPKAQAALAATRVRARALRGDTDWFVRAGYGLQFHWTTRTTPRRGPPQPFREAVDAFDVPGFARMVEETGAGYVIFFSSHADQFWPAPIRAVERILPGRTCRRDLIGELADALRARGVRLMLYHIPSDLYQAAGSAERFYDAYGAILSEVGQRYGDRLAGYWFDFGTPDAPYERLTRAAKAGNPARIVAWQSWVYPKLTDFQDYYGAEYGGTLILPPPGYFEEGGPQAGLQPHATVFIDDPWIHDVRDRSIAPPRFTNRQLIDYVKKCRERRIVVTLNPGIYQDGTIGPETLEQLKALRRAVRGR